MTVREPGKLASSALDLKHICDQCGKKRNTGNHIRCSRKRQALYAAQANRSNEP